MSLYSQTRAVKFDDIDAAGIVFFAKVYAYFNDAILDFLAERGLSVKASLENGDWLLPLVHAEADFKTPMRFSDHIEVSIDRLELKESSLRFELSVRRANEARTAFGAKAADTRATSNVIHATGVMVHVFVAGRTFVKSRIPDAMRDALLAE